MTPDHAARPLVLTALFDNATQSEFERLRAAYFPRERNLVPAHLTLFHALPGAEQAVIHAELQAACSALAPLDAELRAWRFTGRGVAREISSPGLCALRAKLARSWSDWLTAQDRHLWRPHVTVQNKVAPEVARSLHAELLQSAKFESAPICQLVLWRYLGGPWERLATFALGEEPLPY